MTMPFRICLCILLFILASCDASTANKASESSSNPLMIYPESVKKSKALSKDLAAQDKAMAAQAKAIGEE